MTEVKRIGDMKEEEKAYSMWQDLTRELIRRHLTISTMESMTGGIIASLITDTEGASGIFPGGLVTYCNEEKIRGGVPAEVIRDFTVYSAETAGAMARACRFRCHTDIGIGVTGTAGNPDPVNPENSVPGRVWFGISLEDRTETFLRELKTGPRRTMKLAAAAEVAAELQKILELALQI